jgi:hypothetical protein
MLDSRKANGSLCVRRPVRLPHAAIWEKKRSLLNGRVPRRRRQLAGFATTGMLHNAEFQRFISLLSLLYALIYFHIFTFNHTGSAGCRIDHPTGRRSPLEPLAMPLSITTCPEWAREFLKDYILARFIGAISGISIFMPPQAPGRPCVRDFRGKCSSRHSAKLADRGS